MTALMNVFIPHSQIFSMKDEFGKKFRLFLEENGIKSELKRFENPVSSCEESVNETGVEISRIVKTVVFFDKKGNIFAAIVPGTERVDRKKIKQRYQTGKLKIASPEEVLEKTGYPAGGVPPMGFQAKFVMDPKVLKRKEVFTGGGSTHCLMKIKPEEIKKASGCDVFDVSGG